MTAQKKKLDIFRLLEAVDKRDLNFYSKLTDEEKKGFAPIVAMRWLSAISDWSEPPKKLFGNANSANEYYLISTNAYVNKHLWDSNLTGHPELVYQLMAICGAGMNTNLNKKGELSTNHQWIAGFKRGKTSKFVEFIKQYYPLASSKELEYLIEINSQEQLIELVNESGLQDDEVKVLVKEIKELKK